MSGRCSVPAEGTMWLDYGVAGRTLPAAKTSIAISKSKIWTIKGVNHNCGNSQSDTQSLVPNTLLVPAICLVLKRIVREEPLVIHFPGLHGRTVEPYAPMRLTHKVQ